MGRAQFGLAEVFTKSLLFDACDEFVARNASDSIVSMWCSWLLLAAVLVTAAEDPCASPANAIVAENCKQGVSSDIWDVNGAGSPGVRGFATQASVYQEKR